MNAPGVVEKLDVIENGHLGFGSGLKFVAIEPLGFQLAPKRLHRRVVIAVAFPAHAADEAVRF